MKRFRELFVPCLVIIIAFFLKVYAVADSVILPADGDMSGYGKVSGWNNPMYILALDGSYSDTAVGGSKLYVDFADSAARGAFTDVFLHVVHYEIDPSWT